MTGSKGTRAGIRVTQAYTVAAVSAFFDRHRRCRVTGLITHNYPGLRCLRLLVIPVFTSVKVFMYQVDAEVI